MTIDNRDETAPANEYSSVDSTAVVRRCLYSRESVSAEELRAHLQQSAPGSIVELSPSDVDIVVTVERLPEGETEPIHECYTVRPTPTSGGESTLQWTYLGPVLSSSE